MHPWFKKKEYVHHLNIRIIFELLLTKVVNDSQDWFQNSYVSKSDVRPNMVSSAAIIFQNLTMKQ